MDLVLVLVLTHHLEIIVEVIGHHFSNVYPCGEREILRNHQPELGDVTALELFKVVSRFTLVSRDDRHSSIGLERHQASQRLAEERDPFSAFGKR